MLLLEPSATISTWDSNKLIKLWQRSTGHEIMLLTGMSWYWPSLTSQCQVECKLHRISSLNPNLDLDNHHLDSTNNGDCDSISKSIQNLKSFKHTVFSIDVQKDILNINFAFGNGSHRILDILRNELNIHIHYLCYQCEIETADLQKLIKMSLGGPGTTTPNYVRSATFKNTAEGEVTLKVSFQSGHSEDYTIAAGASRTVERDVENGSHTEVDPITGFTATEGGKTANGDWAAANGVENRSYNIAAGGIATQA